MGVATSGLGAASAAGTVASWGVNDFGQLGNNAPLTPTPPPQLSPVRLHPSIPTGKTLTQISAGGQHSCAVTADGLAYCWGANGVGQLGDNLASGEASSIPVAVLATGAIAGKALVQISVGTYHSCAVAARMVGPIAGEATTSGSSATPFQAPRAMSRSPSSPAAIWAQAR